MWQYFEAFRWAAESLNFARITVSLFSYNFSGTWLPPPLSYTPAVYQLLQVEILVHNEPMICEILNVRYYNQLLISDLTTPKYLTHNTSLYAYINCFMTALFSAVGYREISWIAFTETSHLTGFFLIILPAYSEPWSLIQLHNDFFTDGRTLWGSNQPIAKPLPKHRTTQTQNKRIHTPNIHALSGIRTHDRSIRTSEDSSCLRPRGYCDWPSNTH
jgi:hypothetical protein